jgi:hypothetical protein
MVTLRCKVTTLDGGGYERKQSQPGNGKTEFVLDMTTPELWGKVSEVSEMQNAYCAQEITWAQYLIIVIATYIGSQG